MHIDQNVRLASRMNVPADPDAFEVLPVPEAVYTAIDEQAYAVLGDQEDIDPLDGHKLLCREKLAAAIAILRQRNEISEQDWELAGTAMKVSALTRAEVLKSLGRRGGGAESEGPAMPPVTRKIAEAERIADERATKTTRIAEKILAKLKAKNDQTLNWLKKQFSSADKQYVNEALDYLEDDGRIIKRPITYRGQEGLQIHLNDDETDDEVEDES